MRSFSAREDQLVKRVVAEKEIYFKDLFQGLLRNQLYIDLQNDDIKIQIVREDFTEIHKAKIFTEISTVTYLVELLEKERLIILFSKEYNFNRQPIIAGDQSNLDRANFIFDDPNLKQLILKYCNFKILPTHELEDYVHWFCTTREFRRHLTQFIIALASFCIALFFGLRQSYTTDHQKIEIDSLQYKNLIKSLNKLDTLNTIDRKLDGLLELKKMDKTKKTKNPQIRVVE